MKNNTVEIGKSELNYYRKALIALIGSLLIFGTNGIIVSKIILPSYQITLLRALIGTFFLISVFFLSKHKIKFKEYPKDVIVLFLSGMAQGAQWMLTFEAYFQIGVGISTILLYCAPVAVILLSPLFFQEKITTWKVLGVISILLGLALINMQNAETQVNAFGVICGIAAAFLLAACIILNKKVVHITGLDRSLIVMIGTFVIVAVFVGCKAGYSMNIDANEWIWILINGIVNAGIGNYLYFSSISKLPAQTVCICGYLDPLFAVTFSIIFLKECMTGRQLIGAVCIIGGALVAELSGIVRRKT